MTTDNQKKAAIERLTKRIMIHNRKTRNNISEHEARKIAIKAQKKHQINSGD